MSQARKVTRALLPLLWSMAMHGQAFKDIDSAKVSMVNGVPELLINGVPTPPLVFFYNDEAGPIGANFVAQVTAAAQNGIHIYSTPVHWPWLGSDPNAPLNWSNTDAEMQRFVDIDPQAVFIVRIRAEPPSNWSGWTAAPSGDVIQYQNRTLDTSGERLSWGSQYFHDNAIANIRNFVQHYEARARAGRHPGGHPLGKRIVAYHVTSGTSGEWFGFGGGPTGDYRNVGPEYSNANVQAFRTWLQQKYGTDAQLQQSWGSSITLATAAIPIDQARFPLHPQGTAVQTFYSRPAQQDWIDYSAFESDLPSQWILDIARAVKQASNGSKLTAFFYGYTFELWGSFGSHSRLDRLLASPDVDIICAPISYQGGPNNSFSGRWYGGPAGAMAAVDSVAAHGKLWFNENDILSHPVPDTGFDFANRILQRDLASVLTHRAGTWWMDLFATGPYTDPRLWATMNVYGIQNYLDIYSKPKPYLPDVAVIADPISQLYVREDLRTLTDGLAQLRNFADRSGATIGYYTLDDFIDGIAPKCPVYIFANTYYLTDSQITAINQRLDAYGALAIWQYAPGFLGPSSSDAGRTSTLTGITVVQSDGNLGTNGLGPMAGKQWGPRNGSTYSPRFAVQDAGATSLGRYIVDAKISTAIKRVGSHTSLFVGDFILSSDFIRTVVQQVGVNIWTNDDSVVHTDGSLLVVHSGVAGAKNINLPPGVTAQPLSGQLVGQQNGSSISATFAEGETLWFTLQAPGEHLINPKK